MTTLKGGYTVGELTQAVFAEKKTLVTEWTGLMKRLKEINDRLAELDHAENLLENGF
jgi:hypothetical protein